MQRRLAAILAADVVGYSRLMNEDEAATLAALKVHRMEDACAAVAQFERLRPDGYDVSGVARVLGQMCARPEDREHWLEGYRKAGLPV